MDEAGGGHPLQITFWQEVGETQRDGSAASVVVVVAAAATVTHRP